MRPGAKTPLRLVVTCRGQDYDGGQSLAEARAFAADLTRVKPGSPAVIKYIVPQSYGIRREIETWHSGSHTSAR